MFIYRLVKIFGSRLFTSNYRNQSVTTMNSAFTFVCDVCLPAVGLAGFSKPSHVLKREVTVRHVRLGWERRGVMLCRVALITVWKKKTIFCTQNKQANTAIWQKNIQVNRIDGNFWTGYKSCVNGKQSEQTFAFRKIHQLYLFISFFPFNFTRRVNLCPFYLKGMSYR